MNEFTQKLGMMPALILGGMLAIGGGWLLVTIMNNTWLVPIDHVQFNDFRRAVTLDQIDSASLLKAADWRLIAFFLVAVIVFVMGIALPFAYGLNRRWQLERQTEPSILLVGRQSLWLGLWSAFCVWMQMNRSLWWPVALLVGISFILLEGLLVMRTRSAETAANPST